MTTLIASPIFNTLVSAFFLVILIGAALGAYAAIQLGKAQKRYEADEAQMAAAMPVEAFDYAEVAPVEAVVYAEPEPDVLPAEDPPPE